MQRFLKKLIFNLFFLLVLFYGITCLADNEVSFYNNQKILITAKLYQPSGKGPFPAVIGLHGCGGLADAITHLALMDWAKRLVQAGFLVLLPDSYGSRQLGAQCYNLNSRARADVERVSDALAAKTYLQTRKNVKANSISLIGWSNGGTTVLSTIIKSSSDQSFPFAKAIAFYPYCKKLIANNHYHSQIPLLILMGEEDHIMSVSSCKNLIQLDKNYHDPAQLILYPNAGHAFDLPDIKPWTNMQARNAAIKKVLFFLKENQT